MLSENLQSNFLGEFSKNLNLPSLEMHNKVNQVTSLLPCFLKQRSADLQVCKVWSVKKKKKKFLPFGNNHLPLSALALIFIYWFASLLPLVSCLYYLSLPGSVFPSKTPSHWQLLLFARHKTVLVYFVLFSNSAALFNFSACPGNLLALRSFTELCLQLWGCFKPFCWWLFSWKYSCHCRNQHVCDTSSEHPVPAVRCVSLAG